MNFAYVQYFTGTARPKTIISTSAIKNFEPRSEDDYKKGHLYDALLTPDGGEPGCFKAQILLLADSKSSIEERIKRGKRIPLPKALDQVVEHSSSEDDQAALRVEMKSCLRSARTHFSQRLGVPSMPVVRRSPSEVSCPKKNYKGT
ncbi:uncharacterized protein LOC115324254 isoform X4 [Ixodes scapularis]|uniref:uncharacterized protein LOC115324254 isoform X4 n=1 Tax=Ixodes scapularis TaxID=6945 RepID=UPI001A9DBAD2|nr:uncharacterized protein LOC115324254 isoform X4 [Ixodes scapularis]